MRSLALVVALAACGGSSPPPASPAPAPVGNVAAPTPPPEDPAGPPEPEAMTDDETGDAAAPPPRTDAEWKALLATPIPSVYADCAGYRDAIAAFVRCTKVPAETRDAMYVGYAAVVDLYANTNVPADSIVVINSACKSGTDAMKQAIGGMGCTP